MVESTTRADVHRSEPNSAAHEQPNTLYGSLVRARQQVAADKRAVAGLRDGSTWVELSWKDLIHDVETLSTSLAALGLGAGDVICLQLPNWTEAVLYTYAAARLGAVVCPVTTIYRQREMMFILERTECKVVVVPSRYRGHDYAAMVRGLAGDLTDLRHVVCVGPTDVEGVIASADLLQRGPAPIDPPPPTAVDDVAVLAFTSGTTGEPKGVMHSHASMHHAIDDLVGHAGYGQGLSSLVMSPFGHLTGFTWGVLMPLRGAGDVVLLETWDPGRALDLIDEYAVTFTMGASPFLGDLLDAAHKREGARFPDIFVCGGAPIPPVLVERAVRNHGARIVAVWGMSEYPVGTATAVEDDPALASTSDGRPAGQAEVVIVGPSGTPVGIGEDGDLIIRGPGRFLGYFKRPDLDEQSLTDQGFLKTGDRARLLDDHGHIRISGRTKDLIIRGGENIPVVEVENALLTHPSIREVALVPVPHERLGETARACIVLHPGSDEPTPADLGRFLAEKGMARQFTPESVQVMPAMPRTPSGKIQKFALRDQLG